MVAHDRGYTPVCLERPCGALVRSYSAITTVADVIVGGGSVARRLKNILSGDSEGVLSSIRRYALVEME